MYVCMYLCMYVCVCVCVCVCVLFIESISTETFSRYFAFYNDSDKVLSHVETFTITICYVTPQTIVMQCMVTSM